MLARLRPVRAIALLAGLAWLGAITACAGDAGMDVPEPVDAAPDGGDELTELLLAIEGATVVEEFSFTTGYRRFRIAFEQPVDHGDPDGPRFTQMLTLMHRDVAAPMILVSTGYHDFVLGSLAEPAVLLEANQVVVEHRYFGESRPQPADWRYLDIEQAAGDHHRVITALRSIYSGQWVSTGASKGGMTSIFHRRFYPDDVAATIAYVTPLNFSVDDTRYEAFFDQLEQSAGAGECVQRVRDLQREALLRRTELLPYLAESALQMGYTFERVGGLEPAFEIGVVELEWNFWQARGLGSCGVVPPGSASSEVIAEFIDASRVPWTMSDQEVSLFEAYYYQALTQIGYPSVPFAHVADLLQFDYEAGLALLAPAGVTPVYDPAPMRDVADWVASEGERIILIYGAQDPWSAGALTLSKSADAYSFIAPEANHQAGLGDLAFEDTERAIELLRTWAEVPPAALAGVRARSAGKTTPPALWPAWQQPGETTRVRPRLGL
jgi:hypothetical protein